MWFFNKLKKEKRENSYKWTQEREIAISMGCDLSNLTPVDKLAIATVLIPSKINDSASHLCQSDLTKCDTILFSAFVIRAILIGCADNMYAAREFSGSYITKIILGTKHLYQSTSDYFDDMFDNRMNFYDSVFMSKDDIEEKLNVITNEFEFVIKTDIIKKGYIPFSENSPLPILGIVEDMECAMQVKSFFNMIPHLVSPYYKQVQIRLM